ncbi:MAG: orotidine-5'-phosphate decarboxylase [candidate division NC10 bacterium]|nr:orotidine-5'-phosphate decarboxylase [candidate division NC10 bacterium]
MEKLIIALDVETLQEAEKLIDLLRGKAGAFKVGSELFAAAGPAVVEMIHGKGEKVFLDLKFHDIPNTVAKAVVQACRLEVFMLNLHAWGGSEMMRAAAAAARRASANSKDSRPHLLGVTVLTSLDESILNKELGVHRPLREQVVHLAKMAKEAGLDGVVASPQEIREIRLACGKDFLIVTPGVRPAWAAAGDQKRTMTPREAVEAGADYIVVGRPILAASDPFSAASRIIEEIQA